MRSTELKLFKLIVAAPLALGLAGCATIAAAPTAAGTPAAAPKVAAAASAPGAAASRPASAAAAASAPIPGQPPAFATVIKDAKRSDGLIAVWQKDDKVWLELKPEDFGKPFFLSPKLAQGMGEAGFFGGSMASTWSSFGRPQLVEFRRVHNQIQFVATNPEFVAKPGTPEARAVTAGFAVSLLASAPVASLPHPENKTVLVEANSLFLGDMLGIGMNLQRAYRQSYALDRGNSAIVGVRAKTELLVIETQNHFAASSLAIAQPGSPGPQPTAPRSLPDARSMLLGLHYSLARLPDTSMTGRVADPRIGYFTTNLVDFSDDLARSPRVRLVNRWRLEKKDPGAELSEPVKPITFWIDRTVPLKYRGALSAGALEWNRAFEKIGFSNAIVVKVQPDNADFDTLDLGVASVRWMTNSRAQFGAIGPSHIDPRSGEILDADIGFESLSSRGLRALRSQILTSGSAIDWRVLMQQGRNDHPAQASAGAHHDGHEYCTRAEDSAEQLGYALDVLEARGDIDPASPEAERFVLDYLTDTMMHEVGHTLGLRHNFRSSKIYTDKQLSDPEFTRTNGLAGSVMEYAPINLPLPGEKGGTAFQLALGPYDYWAIEYAYKPIASADEKSELQRIAGRSGEPQLAYGTDEDNSLGIDPESLHFDLGDDVLAFARKRLAIARDLLKRQETRELKPTEDYAVLRRAVGYAVRDAGRAIGIVARQIGGIRTLRDFPGTGREPLVPVAAATQREALDILARGALAHDSVVLPASLQRRLAPDYNERSDALFGGDGGVATDFSVEAMVFEMQRALLAQLMSEGVAGRILDSQGKAERPADAFRLSELYARLSRDIWSELGVKGDISSPRRELQREHASKLAAGLMRPGSASRADARSLLRHEAQALLLRIKAAAHRADLSVEARAHLADSAETLTQALAARLARAGA